MAAPAFEEFDPANDCDCPGCTHWRRVLPHSPYSGNGGRLGHPAARRALVLAAATGTALAAGPVAPAVAAAHAPARPGAPAGDEDGHPQGGKAPLHGPAGRPAAAKLRPTTRAEIINRARKWVTAEVPYSMNAYWSDGYRQDCSGFVSMAWNLPVNEWTGSLDTVAERISKDDLRPGDILLFHNPANPERGSHVVIFGGWTDYTHAYYIAYEETPPVARRQATPYAYWTNSGSYAAYRYKAVADQSEGGAPPAQNPAPVPEGGAPAVPAYPGARSFGPGAVNPYVTRLGQLLVARGGARFYTSGPGPRWTDTDRRATQAFQRAQGWTGAAADGYPGPTTWAYLAEGRGRDIPPEGRTNTGAGAGVGSAQGLPGSPGSSVGVPAYPGRGMFRPGANGAYVTQLGRQLVKKGFGKYYTQGPGPRWGEADRRNVEAFQRAQGWRGGAADGYPGPETWRRLFS